MSGHPLPTRLLPDNHSVNADGSSSIGGCRLDEIAETFGTPVFVYDEAHLRARCRDAVSAFGADRVIYATKAFLCRAMARLAHDEGLLLDVATGGEMHVVLSAGVPAERCVLHGNNKSLDELERALTAGAESQERPGVRHVVIDSFDEIDRLETLRRRGLPVPRAQIRVTPGVHAHTHEYIATGQDDSKFGFNLGNGDAARAVRRLFDGDAVELVGLHCHIGSNVFAVDSFAKAADVMARFASTYDLPELTLGGGLGVAYTSDEEAPTIGAWGSVLLDACDALGVTSKVMVEPGRSIVADAAVTLYRVGTVKDVPGGRRYVSVDGGMSDNPRPVLYGSGYEMFAVGDVGARREQTVRLVGKHCESGDVLIFEAAAPVGLAVGDLVGVPVTGAYGHSMASNYNKVPRPPVVFASDGVARLVVRRETLDDLVRLDVD